jgi:hypothetical protein
MRIMGTAAVVLACTAAGAVSVAAVAAPGETGHAAATAKVTARGVDGVRLGMTFTSLRAADRVGALRRGCELAGPKTRGARLRAPLKGTVDLTTTSPRRVSAITVNGGATARGVGVGATTTQVRAAFPKAKVDHSTEEMFGVTLVRVPKGGGGRMDFVVDHKTGKVDAIAIPAIAFCE